MQKVDKVEMLNLKAELLEDIASKYMPDTILTQVRSCLAGG